MVELQWPNGRGSTLPIDEKRRRNPEADAPYQKTTDDIIPLPDLGQRLSIGPKPFRAILEAFSDVITVHEVGGEKVVSEEAARHVENIHRQMTQGFTFDEIRRQLGLDPETALEGSSDASKQEDATSTDDRLLEAVKGLEEQLKRFEKQRIEDRDKLMVTLLRTQKEMQRLRHELRGRRSRRSKTLFERLLGR